MRRRNVKADYWAIFDLPEDVEPGIDAIQLAQNRIDVFAKRWRDSYPAAVRCLLDDRDSLTVFCGFRASTGHACGTRTSLNAPSARPGGGSR
jgi:transposase-like protein